VNSQSFVVLAFSALLSAPLGCKIDDGGGGEAGEEEGTGGPCTCPTGYQWALCTCNDDTHPDEGDTGSCYLGNGDGQCADECEANDDGFAQPMSCQNYPDRPVCSGWDPDNYITFTSGKYHVDFDFLSDLFNDPSPTWSCDDAYLDDLSTGKWQVKAADDNELLWELGLRTNDIPQSLNGMPLEDVIDAYQAFSSLWLGGEDAYTLVVQRNSSNITLLYLVE
jgi:hypothetical protein